MHKKRNFKIKLVVPCRFETYDPYSHDPFYYLPYGMGILTSFLRQSNYYVEQEDLSIRFNRHHPPLFSRYRNKDMDFNTNKIQIDKFFETGEIGGRLRSLIDKILATTPLGGFDVLGFSILSFNHFLFALIFSKIIKQKTDIRIVFGGPFITLFGHLYPEAFNTIDYMIVGDGGIPLLKLIDHLNNLIAISEVPNISYRDNGNLASGPKTDYPIENIPLPDFSDLPLELYKNKHPIYTKNGIMLPYQLTRGCTKRCSFCIRICIYDRLEFKSHDKVIRELRQMQEKYKSSIFYFCDEAINNSYHYLEELCDLFIKHKLNINWNTYAKVGNLDKRILKKMKEAGCYCLNFGIESGSDRILEMMDKGFNTRQASRTLKEVWEVGLKNWTFIMVGYPYEKQEDIEQTIEFIKDNKKYIYYAPVYKFQLIYGSGIYLNSERHNITNMVSSRLYRFIYAFDESNGLKWKEKQKQQEDSKRQIIIAICKHIKIFKNNKDLRCLLLFRDIILKVIKYVI